MRGRIGWSAGLLAILAGCADGPAPPGPATVAMAPSRAGLVAEGHRVRFRVDGQEFRFFTPEIRHSRARVGEGVVANSFELATPDNTLYARVVINAPAGRRDLSGDYPAVALGEDDYRGREGVGEVVLAEETDADRGRRMMPSGAGLIQVRRQGDDYVVAFQTRGDDLFRPAAAAPITGELRFSALP